MQYVFGNLQTTSHPKPVLLPKLAAVQIITGGQCSLELWHPIRHQSFIHTAAAIFRGNIDTHRYSQSIIIKQALPVLTHNPLFYELIMIVPENWYLQVSADLDFPMDGDGEGKIIDPQPGREAPSEGLPIN